MTPGSQPYPQISDSGGDVLPVCCTKNVLILVKVTCVYFFMDTIKLTGPGMSALGDQYLFNGMRSVINDTTIY